MKNLQLLAFVAMLLTTAFTANQVTAQKALPEVKVQKLDGAPVNVKEAYGNNGKITVFSFWATWCSPCKKELDAIMDVYEDWQDDYNMELVAVSIDDARTTTKVAGLVSSRGWDYEVLKDIQRELMQALQFQDVPYTIVVDADGKIAYTHNGYNPGDEDELEEKLKELSSK